LEKLEKSHKLYARKLDDKVDNNLLIKLDGNI
jgi:hypothetical protein